MIDEFGQDDCHVKLKGAGIVIKLPGGGLGDPASRDPELVRRVLEHELISEGSARTRCGKL